MGLIRGGNLRGAFAKLIPERFDNDKGMGMNNIHFVPNGNSRQQTWNSRLKKAAEKLRMSLDTANKHIAAAKARLEIMATLRAAGVTA